MPRWSEPFQRRILVSGIGVLVGLVAVFQHNIVAVHNLHVSLSDTLASLGLFAVCLVLLDWLVFWLSAGTFNRILQTGLIIGLLTGLVGGHFYAASAEPRILIAGCTAPGITVLYVRLIVFATIIGACLHGLITVFRLPRLLPGFSKLERVGVMAAGVLALGLLATYFGENIHELGRIVRFVTGGAVDWIGSGTCYTLKDTNDGGVKFDPVSGGQIGALLLSFGVIEFIYLSRTIKLSVGYSILGIVILPVLAFLAVFVFLLFQPGRGIEGMLPFAAIWAAFAAALSFLLSWTSTKGVAQALADAFKDSNSLDAFLHSRFGQRLDRYSTSPDIEMSAAKLAARAENEGWVDNLVIAAREAHWTNPVLAAVADSMGVGIDMADAEGPMMVPESEFEDPRQRRAELAKVEKAICRIEYPSGTPFGTGLLVGADKVLTAWHIYEELVKAGAVPGAIVFRFDLHERDGFTVVPGTPFYGAETDFLISSSEAVPKQESGRDPRLNELDYALLRLAKPAGSLPLGPQGAGPEPGGGSVKRDWLKIETARVAEVNQRIAVIQHPKGRALTFSDGIVIGFNTGHSRIYHSAKTAQGSSGAPCLLYYQLSVLVALHDARYPDDGRRRAVPLSLIDAAIQESPAS